VNWVVQKDLQTALTQWMLRGESGEGDEVIVEADHLGLLMCGGAHIGTADVPQWNQPVGVA
jgi:hypothetical protein